MLTIHPKSSTCDKRDSANIDLRERRTSASCRRSRCDVTPPPITTSHCTSEMCWSAHLPRRATRCTAASPMEPPSTSSQTTSYGTLRRAPSTPTASTATPSIQHQLTARDSEVNRPSVSHEALQLFVGDALLCHASSNDISNSGTHTMSPGLTASQVDDLGYIVNTPIQGHTR